MVSDTSRRKKRADRIARQPLEFHRAAAPTIFGTAIVVGLAAWWWLHSTSPDLFDQYAPGKSGATWLIALIVGVAVFPVILYWSHRARSDRAEAADRARRGQL